MLSPARDSRRIDDAIHYRPPSSLVGIRNRSRLGSLARLYREGGRLSGELLAKLTAKGLSISGGGFGGEITIRPEDVAGALRGVRGAAYYFVLLKYTGDNNVATTAVDMLARCILDGDEGVSDPTEAKLYASAIILDNIRGDVCRTCNGTGQYRYKTCRGCKGAGKKPPSTRARARSVGLSDYDYRKAGEARFTRWASYLNECESYALSKMSHNVRRGRFVEGGREVRV